MRTKTRRHASILTRTKEKAKKHGKLSICAHLALLLATKHQYKVQYQGHDTPTEHNQIMDCTEIKETRRIWYTCRWVWTLFFNLIKRTVYCRWVRTLFFSPIKRRVTYLVIHKTWNFLQSYSFRVKITKPSIASNVPQFRDISAIGKTHTEYFHARLEATNAKKLRWRK